MNRIIPHEPYIISDAARKLHDSLYVADLHSDSLMWRRNLAQQNDRGHVDLPRLRQGGVDFQVFSAVTKSPRGQNFDQNDANAPDNIKRLVQAQLWPLRTWNSIYERAVFQAKRLQKLEANPAHNLIIARTSSDMTHVDVSQAQHGLNKPIVTLLLTEGSHPLQGRLENIDRLYDVGYRAMGLQHFFDNELGGSMHGRSQAGLTDFGRQAVRHMVEKNIIIDVAHSSEAVVRDVLALTDAPLLLSHGGLRSHCPKTANRNLPDDILIAMAARGSLIGIGYFDGVICDITPMGIALAIEHAVNILGEDNVALGSDFDGTVTTTFDTSELAILTQHLMSLGLSESIIRKVMGENARRFFRQNLPL